MRKNKNMANLRLPPVPADNTSVWGLQYQIVYHNSPLEKQLSIPEVELPKCFREGEKFSGIIALALILRPLYAVRQTNLSDNKVFSLKRHALLRSRLFSWYLLLWQGMPVYERVFITVVSPYEQSIWTIRMSWGTVVWYNKRGPETSEMDNRSDLLCLAVVT